MTELPRVIEVTEYATTRVPGSDLREEDVALLWSRHGDQVAIEPPSFKNAYSWELRSNGFVGFIPVSERVALRLRPKVPLSTLFGMLEWAYRIDASWLEGRFGVDTIEEFYERLAMILAKRALDRSRRGLYREYVPMSERLAFVSGAIDLHERLQRPWTPAILCDFHEHSADVPENQVIAWTLYLIAQNGLCTERSRPTIRRAYHAFQGATTLRPFRGRDCVNRSFNRLNDDYRPMIALARFFLEHSGAVHAAGHREMLPFMVEMSRLFEGFVAAWLQVHLPGSMELRVQERLQFEEQDDLIFKADMLVREARTGRALLVLDAKYKVPDQASNADISQVVTYAEATGAKAAALIYPASLPRPLNVRIGDILVRGLTFDLSRSIEDGGEGLLRQVLDMCPASG